jgi:hypothetical protein
MTIITRNTFLDFTDEDFGERTVKHLRRASTDPCIVSSPEDIAVSEAPVTQNTALEKSDQLKVFVGSLPAHCDEPNLSHFMSFFGEVAKVSIKRNLQTGQSRRYGYVKFKNPPREEVFTQQWFLGDRIIRIRKYQVNPCWKNEYVSDSSDGE